MSSERPVALVTGAARRIGAAIAETLHGAGYSVAVHFGSSAGDAEALCRRLPHARPFQAELDRAADCEALAAAVLDAYGGVDLLVNNASAFFPTPMGGTSESQWDDLLASNLKSPFFLSQAMARTLAERYGAIVNITDIHAAQPLAGYPVYCAAKAGLTLLTRALAAELAPAVRVNAVAPGTILWPEGVPDDPAARAAVIGDTALGRQGEPGDVAEAVLYLARARYVTGHELVVDGGRSLAR